MIVSAVIFNLIIVQTWGRPETALEKDDRLMHHFENRRISKREILADNVENDADFWLQNAQFALNERLSRKPNENIAKNVILFLGDGMSIPTISAARVYIAGESSKLSFDKFPFTGLSMTYCVDRQVADSACSSTAYLGGVKGNLGTLGVTGAVRLNDCQAMRNQSNHVYSIAEWSQRKGKRTGLVTTARVTHASPAGLYAHTAQRDWESDTNVINAQEDPLKCRDIAQQLVHGKTGNNLNVILGGGRSEFFPKEVTDNQGKNGYRSDQVNLVNEWLENQQRQKRNAEYVWTRNQMLKLNEDIDYLLGLFAADHIPYNLERNKTLTPSLEEMTETAIKTLDKSPDGYFLFVEGARIDMGHHESWARKALDETNEFAKAVQKAVDMTNEEDTLIVVTADHAHTMSYSGYPQRGNDIFGFAGKDKEGYLYSTLNYANGRGYHEMESGGKRHNMEDDDMGDINYRYPGVYPMDSETHGGDDVTIYARGPWSHLFTGVMEQNVIPHLMAFASCVNDGVTVCDSLKEA